MGTSYRKDFVTSHLDELTRCTRVGIELLTKLYSLNLIDEAEQDELVSFSCLQHITI